MTFSDLSQLAMGVAPKSTDDKQRAADRMHSRPSSGRRPVPW